MRTPHLHIGDDDARSALSSVGGLRSAVGAVLVSLGDAEQHDTGPCDALRHGRGDVPSHHLFIPPDAQTSTSQGVADASA